MNYVLVTTAKNEEALIRNVLESVCFQILPPLRWVIVDDGSSDATPGLIEDYANRYDWIDFVKNPPQTERTFARKANAVNKALERVEDLEYEVVGNLDADVSFEAGYMEYLMKRFAEESNLGVAGTPFTEAGGYDSTKDSFEGENYVAGPCQLFRRSCWQDIGGYMPNAAGGVDWIAVMTARMKGWKVKCFQEKRFHHHRPMGTAMKSPLAAMFSYGRKDYYLGGSPIWQLFRVAFRMMKRPYVFGGLALLFGYTWAALTRMRRPVSRELMRYHRADQMKKLRAILRSLLGRKRINHFTLSEESHKVS